MLVLFMVSQLTYLHLGPRPQIVLLHYDIWCHQLHLHNWTENMTNKNMRNDTCICRGKQSILFTCDMLGFLATYLNLSVDLSYFTSTSLLSSTQNSIKTESRLSYHLAVDGCLLNKEIYIDKQHRNETERSKGNKNRHGSVHWDYTAHVESSI